MKYISHSQRETEFAGERLARELLARGAARGSVIALYGDLGAGKTAFVRGLACGLGYGGRVTSPTFAIVNEYPGDIPLFHFDMYRLGSSDDLFDIGWDDYLMRGGVCVVEWSERVADALPPDALSVRITAGNSEDTREILIDE